MSNIPNLVNQWFCYAKSKQNRLRNNNIWVFGEWFGDRCGDNSAFLANYIADNHPEIKIYWIAKKACNTEILKPTIQVLQMDSSLASTILSKAGIIVVNQNLLDLTSDGVNRYATAITLNLWHGIMWKQIGHDGDKRKKNILFKIYCFLLDPVQRCKYYIIPSDIYGEKIHSAFGADKSRFIKCGYPRNSLFYNTQQVANCSKELRTAIGASSDATIVTYMPTFRDKGDTIEDLRTIHDKDFLMYLETQNVYIVQKAHFVNQKAGRNNYSMVSDRILCLDDVNPTNLLAATDLLITDYSSCFFDYLILNRPIIHYLYDFEKYKNNDRGLYFEQGEVVCGDVVYTKNDLMRAIIDNLDNPTRYSDRRLKMKKTHATYESEDSCKIIFEQLMKIQEDDIEENSFNWRK